VRQCSSSLIPERESACSRPCTSLNTSVRLREKGGPPEVLVKLLQSREAQPYHIYPSYDGFLPPFNLLPLCDSSYASSMMRNESIPTLRRKSSSGTSCVDPFDQAEKGLDFDSPKVPNTTHPIEPRKTFSFRSSLRSSDSTLVGIPGEYDDLGLDSRAANPFPSQGKLQSVFVCTASSPIL
jgi:hypothetical protein